MNEKLVNYICFKPSNFVSKLPLKKIELDFNPYSGIDVVYRWYILTQAGTHITQ